jgi:hypothetical protein
MLRGSASGRGGPERGDSGKQLGKRQIGQRLEPHFRVDNQSIEVED